MEATERAAALVDEGRSVVGPAGTFAGFVGADAPSQADLYKCVHCGFCLSACPTYLETGLETESPRGRIALMKAVGEGRLAMTDAVVRHWELCLQCRACEVACPSGVPYGSLMEAVRTEVKLQVKRPVRERLARSIGYNRVLPRPRLLRAVGIASKLYRRSGMRAAVRRSGLLRILPGDAEALDNALPELSDNFFAARGQVVAAIGVRRARVSMLAGCVMALTHAATLEAATRVLSRNGVEVHVTRNQGCCGALNLHAGERGTARDMARRNIDSLLAVDPDAVIVASAGCGSTMKEYGDLLDGDPVYRDRARDLASLTRDIHEFLVDLPMVPPTGRVARTVVYQDACHLLNAQHIAEAPRQVLRSIPGLRLVEMAESAICCGSAGTYSITQRDMSQRLGRRKAGNIIDSGAAIVATGNPGCALQMVTALGSSGSAVEVRYVVDLLDEAYGSRQSQHRQ